MGVLQLIGILALIGLALWVFKYLAGEYIEPWIMTLIHKIAVVGVVCLIVFWVLAMFGVVPPVHIKWW